MASSLSLKSPVEPRKSGSPLSTPIPAPAKLKSWMKNEDPTLQVLHFYNIFFFGGGGRHSHKNLFFVGWEISRACREDQGIAAGNGLRVQSCRIQKGWVERVEKGVNRKTKKSCTIFHHRPFSIYEKVHGIRTISLWRKKHMEKICIAQLKISSDWSLRGSFQSRFNLTLAR